jgi:hypothetical protein
MRRSARGLVLALLAVTSFARSASATVDAAVRGVVEDERLAPFAGATVVLHDSAGHTVAQAETGADGKFQFVGVPFGDYTVEATAPGLMAAHRHLPLAASENAEVELILVHAEAVITVVEQAEAPPPSRAPGSVATLPRAALTDLPGADDRAITDVLGTQAGFVADALGNVYARGNHANVQYQIDGIPVPDSVGSLFAASLPVRLIESVEIYSGGMPAEFGDRLGAVVNIATRQGAERPDGALTLRYGSFDTVEPGVAYGARLGDASLFVGGGFVFSNRALDPPAVSPILHDQGVSGRAFTRVDLPAGDADRVELFATAAHNVFHIPLDPSATPLDPDHPRPPDAYGNDAPAFVPHDTDASETEDEVFAAASWVHTLDGGARLQLAPSYKLSRGALWADAAHALGPQADPGATASDVTRTAHHLGGVAHLSVPLGEHLLKTGVQADILLGRTDFRQYLRDDNLGGVASSQAGSDSLSAVLAGAYVEDRWTTGPLVLSGGVRVDGLHVSPGTGGARDDVGISPRLGASLALSDDVAGHAFTGVGWQPPAPLDAANAARALGLVAPDQPVAYDLQPETDLYAELGVDARLARPLRAGLTAWGRYAWNQLDDTAIGATSLLSNYNFERGRAAGVEATADLRLGWLSAFANLSWGLAEGQGISSARFLFSADDLANHDWQTLDHAQTWTANVGATLRERRFLLSALTGFGSGLRTGPANQGHVPAHVRTDLSMQYELVPAGWPVRVGVEVLNVWDTPYTFRIGNGFVGSSTAPPRSVFLTLSFGLAAEEHAGAP